MFLFTNRQDFFNDICEEIRLFLPGEEIAPVLSPAEIHTAGAGEKTLSVVLSNDGTDFFAEAAFVSNGREHSYSCRTPFRNDDSIIEKRFSKRCIKIAVFRAMRKAYPDAHLPWGSLTGIRPTRLLRELQHSCGSAEAKSMMLNDFDVTPQKFALAERIVSVQEPIFASVRKNDVDVYIGIPFCRTRCLYCSFASRLRTAKTDMQPYLAALKTDIANGAQMVRELGLNIRALYLGGGTPTVLTADELRDLLDFAEEAYNIAPGTEFTVEAGRPDTITAEKLRIIKQRGATRISVNPQTMCDKTLQLVGRDHTSEDIKACFNLARDIGFDSINMDLIAGLPGETAADMQHSVNALVELSPECLTVHTLAIKRSSRLRENLSEYALPDVSEVEKMTEIGALGAEKTGMLPYYMYRQKYMAGNMENVGYAKPGSICIYNIDMMEDSLSIIAHGAGAMNKRVFPSGGRIERVPNPKDIETYISKLQKTHADRLALFCNE